MFGLRLSWIEGFALGMIALLTVMVFYLFQSNADTARELAKTQAALSSQETVSQFHEQTRAVDQDVITTVNTMVTEARHNQVTQRNEVIDEYLRKLRTPSGDAVPFQAAPDLEKGDIDRQSPSVEREATEVVTDEASAPPDRNSVAEPQRAVDETGTAERDRIAVIARGLRQSYCDATTTADGCPTQ